MQSDLEEDFGEDPLEKILARERSLYRTLSPFPDARTGLTRIQTECLGRRYGGGGQYGGGEPLQTERRSLARIIRSIAQRTRQPLEVVFWDFFRLVQPITPIPMFEQMPAYASLVHSMESTEIFQSQPFQEFLESQYLPELTEFGLDMLRDEVLCNLYPRPVGLPLHLVLGIGFDLNNKPRGTNFPPHNMTEVIDALLAKLEKPTMKSSDLRKIVLGPDFFVGGTITATSEELSRCYIDGEGTTPHKCDIEIDNDNNIHLAVLEPMAAFRTLASALKNEQLSGIFNVVRRDCELVASLQDGADIDSIKSSIHALPGFTTMINFDMTVVVGIEEKKRYAGPLHSCYTTIDGFPVVDMKKRRLPLDQILQAFIEHRLRFLTTIHKIGKKDARWQLRNELIEFKEKYGSPRRTRIQIVES